MPQGNNPGTILHTIFPAPPGFIEVGIPGSGGYSMQFTTADAITAYLPAGGKPKPLNADYQDQISTNSGVFGGQVLALQLNVLYDSAFGDLTFINPGTFVTVTDVLIAATQALGGGALPFGYTLSSLNDLVSLLNQGFDNCLPSGWVQQYLTPGSSGPLPPPS